MHAARGFGILSLLLLASCAAMKPPAPAEPQTTTETAAPRVTSTAPQIAPAPIVPPRTDSTPVAPSPAVAPTAPPSASQDTAKAAPPSPKPTAKAPVPAASLSKPESAAADATKQRAPPLDLDSLEQRLKDTKAIGVLTKITLKNQVDDLLDKFRAYYQGKLRVTLAELRRSFDLLVQKVLSLLQDSDPSLAMAIVSSRDALWGILSDPKKFATV